MSRYDSASHVFYRCQYHIVWTPKYRYKILKGNIAQELARSIYVFCNMKNCRVVELNVQPDHVHLVVRTPPSQSVSDLMGVLKGRTAIRLFAKFPYLRKKKLWGNHFWQRGYFLSLDQILIPCAIRSLAARKPSSLLCRASQPSQRAPQLAIPVRLLSIKPPSLAIAM